MKSVGIIGIGAFGEFMLKHIVLYFRTTICDPHRDLSVLVEQYNVIAGSIEDAASQDVVILAVPLQRVEETARAIAPHVRRNALVVDVCSVKTGVINALLQNLPPEIDIISTHPLFGPNSGRDGIKGLKIGICAVRGDRLAGVHEFLSRKLQLDVIVTSPREHDQQMAYVQGLTHLIAKAIVKMGMPDDMPLTTTTFDYLMKMVGVVKDDLDELFRVIEFANPYAADVKARFLTAMNEIGQAQREKAKAEKIETDQS